MAAFRYLIVDGGETVAENVETKTQNVVLLKKQQVVVVELNFGQSRRRKIDLETKHLITEGQISANQGPASTFAVKVNQKWSRSSSIRAEA